MRINKNILQRDKIIFGSPKEWSDLTKPMNFEVDGNIFRDLYKRNFIPMSRINLELYQLSLSLNNTTMKFFGLCDKHITFVTHIVFENYTADELAELIYFVYFNRSDITKLNVDKDAHTLIIEF